MCLHGGVHGQEVALQEATECRCSHFSDLENDKKAERVDEELKFKKYCVTTVQYSYNSLIMYTITQMIILELAGGN